MNLTEMRGEAWGAIDLALATAMVALAALLVMFV